MSIYKKYIRQLIEEEVSKTLLEQELTPEEPAVDAPAPGATGVDAPEGGGEEIDVDLGGAEEGLDLGGEEGEGLEGAEGEGLEGEEGEEGAEDFGGGGLGGFGGGGGFSFGGSGEEGLEPDSEEEEATATTVGPEDVELPDDPVMKIADEAVKLLKTTREPDVILKSVKASIQRYFEDFDEATPVIKALWDTEDLALRDVARRLLLFIRGI